MNENGNVGVFVSREGIWNVSEREGPVNCLLALKGLAECLSR